MLAKALQVGGLALVSVGLWMQWPWLGVAVAGGSAVLIGVVTEVEDARKPPPQ